MCIRDSIQAAIETAFREGIGNSVLWEVVSRTVCRRNSPGGILCAGVPVRFRVVLAVQAVSYTHLDVYKRQERYLLDRWIEERLWNEVKADLQIPKEDLKEMQHRAVHMAVEAIQLAAMICKLERSQRRWPEKIREL